MGRDPCPYLNEGLKALIWWGSIFPVRENISIVPGIGRRQIPLGMASLSLWPTSDDPPTNDVIPDGITGPFSGSFYRDVFPTGKTLPKIPNEAMTRKTRALCPY